MAKAPSTEQMSAELREKGRQAFVEPSEVKQRLYHGTTKDIAQFDPTQAGSKTGNPNAALGTFLSDSPPEANRYATQWGTEGGNVMPVHVQAKNPYHMSYKEFNDLAMGAWNRRMQDPDYDPNARLKFNDREGHKKAAKKLQQHHDAAVQDTIKRRNELIKEGHDSIITKIGGNKEYIMFHPHQIKSAIGNRGTYDTTNSDVNKAQGGAVHLAAGKSVGQMSAELREKGRQAFLEPSEVKQRMYHGTARDISQFKPKQAGASFVTPNPKFAHDFADLSESWMRRNAGTILTGEQIERAKDLTAKEMTKHQTRRIRESLEREIALIGSPQAHAFTQTLYANKLAEQLPSAQNTMPVHVQAKKPFDYENPKHIHAVRTMLHKLGHTQHIDDFDTAMRGDYAHKANWQTIESKPVQQAIRALGHDSFWVKEGGVKNLGVYNPGAIKSAIGNRGTYDTEDYDVNKAQGGAVHLKGGKSVGQMSAEMREKGRQAFLEPSKVKDVLYHGSLNDINEFKPGAKGLLGPGVYLTPHAKAASGYASFRGRIKGDATGANVVPVHAQIKNPYYFDNDPLVPMTGEHVERLKALGHDAAILRDTEGNINQVNVFHPHQIKSAIGNRGTYDTTNPDITKAQGGAVKPVKLKEGQQPPYQDPKTSKIDDWKWHPMERIRQELSARRELPEHVTPYADYMREMNAKAQAGELTPRDLVKAYTITQSSIGRGGLSHSMATSRGMKLPKTGGEVRPEGAFAEWLGSPMGQKYLDASMRGEDHPEAMEDLRAKFAPFGKQNAQVEAMQYATKTLPQRVASANYAVTGGKDDYRKFAGNIRGIAGAKSGFIGSLLGRGDLPTLDARQLNLHSLSHPTKTPEGMMSRGKGLGGQEAVDRLIARQDALGYKIPKELAPYAQHLIHHDVWDQRGGTKTTHEDLIKAMRGYADGGDVEKMRRKLARSQPKGHLESTPLKPNPAIGSRYDITEATGLAPQTPVDLEQHKGASVMMLPWDSTSRNVEVRGISGRKLPKPVVTHGGQDYARDLEHIAQGIAGASGEAIAKRIATRESIARMENEQAGGTGGVLHLPITMGPRAEDFSMTPTEILHHFVQMAKLPQSEIDRMNQQIRQHKIPKKGKLIQPFTKFVGLTDPKFYQQIHTGEGLDTTAGELRKAVTNRLGYLKENQKALGFNMEDIVSAITDPALRGVPKGYVGNTVIGSDPDQMTLTPSKNKAYDTNFSGRYLGTLGSSFPAEVLFKQRMANLDKEFAGKKGDIRNMTLGALSTRNENVSQMLNNQTLDEYGKYLMERDRMLKQGKYAKGGKVAPVSMDEMMAYTTLGKKAPNVRNIGADEAPDMKVKQYISPGPGKGIDLPAGGVDFQPEMPGHQLTQAAPAGPAMPGMPPGMPGMPGMPPGMPPGGPGMPPGGPGPGMPGMPPPLPRNQPGMPTGKPAGLEPPNIPPPKQKPSGSNILSMTPQGQALAALGPMRKMADGGSVPKKQAPVKQRNVYSLLRKFGRIATSTEDAERALSNGDRVFFGHDMEEEKPTEVRNTGDMRNYTSDQIIILPARHMAEGGGVKHKVEVRPTVKDETLQRKIPEMETAVKALHAGVIDHAEYDRIVLKHKPVKPYDFVPQPASNEDAARALKDTQKPHWRGAEQWPAGRKVGLRLDIPAYERHGVWVNSIHDEEGKEGDKFNTSYGPVSSVKNAVFDPKPEKAERVATGEQDKSPFARIKGELHPISENDAVKLMQEHLHHPDWAQVGMDPRRHGFFYDRKTLQPVTHSEHVVQIGPLVLAKKPKYGKRETYSHGGGVTLPPSTEQMRQALSARRSNSKA